MNLKYTYNKTLIVEPFPSYSVKSKVSSGFAELEQKINMTPLKVIIGNKQHDILAGDVVWVEAEQYKQPWAKKIFNIDNQPCIVLPEEFIQFVEKTTFTVKVDLSRLENCQNDNT